MIFCKDDASTHTVGAREPVMQYIGWLKTVSWTGHETLQGSRVFVATVGNTHATNLPCDYVGDDMQPALASKADRLHRIYDGNCGIPFKVEQSLTGNRTLCCGEMIKDSDGLQIA